MRGGEQAAPNSSKLPCLVCTSASLAALLLSLHVFLVMTKMSFSNVMQLLHVSINCLWDVTICCLLQLFEQLARNCSKLKVVDAIAADRASLDALLDGLASALRHQLVSIQIAGVNNTLRLHKLAFAWSCLEELDLSWHNDLVFGLPEFLSACTTVKVRKGFSSNLEKVT